MEDDETRVAQVMGSEARDALRGQRSHVSREHQVLLPAEGHGSGRGSVKREGEVCSNLRKEVLNLF